MQAKQHVKKQKIKVDKNLEKVFIVFGTVTPSVKKCQVVRKMVCNNMLKMS